ncbi:MAG TPA: hypothetical protein VH540_27655 [Ktedonobacterales bacterium]|jgi:hypothetical protein
MKPIQIKLMAESHRGVLAVLQGVHREAIWNHLRSYQGLGMGDSALVSLIEFVMARDWLGEWLALRQEWVTYMLYEHLYDTRYQCSFHQRSRALDGWAKLEWNQAQIGRIHRQWERNNRHQRWVDPDQ